MLPILPVMAAANSRPMGHVGAPMMNRARNNAGPEAISSAIGIASSIR